jgi:hypothetical protein
VCREFSSSLLAQLSIVVSKLHSLIPSTFFLSKEGLYYIKVEYIIKLQTTLSKYSHSKHFCLFVMRNMRPLVNWNSICLWLLYSPKQQWQEVGNAIIDQWWSKLGEERLGRELGHWGRCRGDIFGRRWCAVVGNARRSSAYARLCSCLGTTGGAGGTIPTRWSPGLSGIAEERGGAHRQLLGSVSWVGGCASDEFFRSG